MKKLGTQRCSNIIPTISCQSPYMCWKNNCHFGPNFFVYLRTKCKSKRQITWGNRMTRSRRPKPMIEIPCLKNVQVSNRLQYRPKDAMHPTLGFIAIMCAFPVRARESQSMCPESGTIWCLPECVSFGPLHQISYWQDNIFKNLRTLTSLKQSTSVKPQAATNPHLTKCHLACKQPSPLCLEKRSKHFRVRAG